MGSLTPVAFDLETSGLESSAVITVVGLATDMGAWLGLNTAGRDADAARLAEAVEQESGANIRLSVHPDERGVLLALGEFATARLDGDQQYLTAYFGETYTDGFDLPFLRRACVRQDVDWPFPDVAYADVRTVMQRFTTEASDLAGVYEELIGGGHCDPFADSERAVVSLDGGSLFVAVEAEPLAEYLEKARATGLVTAGEDTVFADPDGAPIDPEQFELVQSRARAASVNVDGQGSVCAALHESRNGA